MRLFFTYSSLFFANSKILFHISRGHSNSRLRCNRMSYFLTCFSFPALRIPLSWINSQYRLARVEQKGFSCLEENVLRTVTIEMIGKFLPSLIHPFLSLLSFSSAFATRHELLHRDIALINVSQHIYIGTQNFMYVHINRKSSGALIAICCKWCTNFSDYIRCIFN